MTDVALFHSALGPRQGVLQAAGMLEERGHKVRLIDQFGGLTFDDWIEADRYVMTIGFAALLADAEEQVAGLPNGFVAVGFSNGGAMAQHVACRRDVAGCVLFSGAIPLATFGHPRWPAATPVQIHYTRHDPFRTEDWPEQFAAEVVASGASLEFLQYPGEGHLFTDPSLPTDYDPVAAALAWTRALAFVEACR